MTWVDLLDILIIAFLIYRLLLMLRGTRAIPMGIGLLSLLVMDLASDKLHLRTVSWLMSHIFSSFVLVLFILFQHEIRRFLASLSRFRFSRSKGRKVHSEIEDIVLAVTTLASTRTGALIVIERSVGMESILETGIRLHALLSYDLLVTIFIPRGPLHDGAVIVQGDEIAAAACFLPLTTNPYLARTLGTRHRAAIGVTEESDALAIVVSEESGKISLAENGRIRTGLTSTLLREALIERLVPEPRSPQTQHAPERPSSRIGAEKSLP